MYMNHDIGMTLICFTARSTLVAYTFEWGNLVKCYLMRGNLQMHRRFMIIKKNCPQVVVFPCPVAVSGCFATWFVRT